MLIRRPFLQEITKETEQRLRSQWLMKALSNHESPDEGEVIVRESKPTTTRVLCVNEGNFVIL